MPNPDALARLKAWVIEHGGTCNEAVELVTDDNGYTRAVTTSPLSPNTTIVSCPRSLILDWNKAVESVPEVLAALATPKDAGKNEKNYERPIWAFFLAIEYVRGKESAFFPYIDCLPRPDQLAKDGLFFGQDMGEWAVGTNLRNEIDRRIEAWRGDFDWVVLACAETGEEWQDITRAVTWELFLWASLIYTSRAFPDSLLEDMRAGNSLEANTALKGAATESARPALVPLVDMLNHKPYQKITWMKGSDSLSLVSVEETPAGEELFNNYGPKGNAELITGYGFAIEGNPFDTFPLTFNPPLGPAQKKIRSKQATRQDSSVFHLRFRDPATPEQKDSKSHLSILSACDSIFPSSLITLVELLVASHRELSYLSTHPSASPVSLRNSLTRDMQLLAAVNSKMAAYTINESVPAPSNNIQNALKIYMNSQHAFLVAAKSELEARLAEVATPAARASHNAVTLADLLSSDQPFSAAVEEIFGSAEADDLREAGYAEQIFALGITRKYILYKQDASSPHLPPNWRTWLEGVIPYVPFLGDEQSQFQTDDTWKEWEERRKENSWWVWQDILSGGDAHELFAGKGWGLEAVLWGQRVWDEEGWIVNGVEGIGLSSFEGEE